MANHEGTVTSIPLRLHNVLLALAGRIDDGALGHARQLSAAARVDEAGEVIAGTLIAGGIPLRPSERCEFGEVLAASGADIALLDELITSEHDVEQPHGFSADDQPDAGVAAAFDPIKVALADVRSIHAVWRTTAAGRVPCQVPRRVVLVELGAQGSAPATAHLVAAALRNAGIRAGVEVASADVAWTNYHRQALAAAVPIVGGTARASMREVPRPEQAVPPVPPVSRQGPASETERPVAPQRPAESAHFFTVQEKPAFATHAGQEPNHGTGESVPPRPAMTSTTPSNGTASATEGTNEANEFEAQTKPNGHHRADRQSADAFWPQSERVAEPQPTAPQRNSHAAAPASNGYAVEPPRNGNHVEQPVVDRPGETPRSEPAFEPPRGNHAAEPSSNGQHAEPLRSANVTAPVRNDEQAEPPRNGVSANQPRNGHSVAPPRAEPPSGKPPRHDDAERPNNGGSQVLQFPESAAESTAEIAGNDAQQLHQALRDAEAADRTAAQPPQRETVQLSAADAEAQLSDRDRELLRELHAELAKREREQAAQVQLNGWHRPGG